MSKSPTWDYQATTVGFSAPKKGSQKRAAYDRLREEEIAQAQASEAIQAPEIVVPEIHRTEGGAKAEYDALPAKPLTGAEAKRLEQIVRQDFQQAYQDIQTHVAEYRSSQSAAIEEAYGTDEALLEQVKEEVKAFIRQKEDEIDSFLKDLKERGFEPRQNRHYGDGSDKFAALRRDFMPVGKEKALQALGVQIQTAEAAAFDSLRRSEREANRKVLLAGITTPQALVMLDSIPRAADVFAATNQQAALTAGSTEADF